MLLIYGCFVNSAPLKNVPIKITQPDNTEISCYTSGDEFCHWLHDKEGNVIVQDTISNYYCYILEGSDSLVVVRNNYSPVMRYAKSTPSIQQERNKNIKMYNQLKKRPYQFAVTNTKSTTTINNIVIYVTFSDQADFTNSELNSIWGKFNDSYTNANSLKQYFWESSYHQLMVNTLCYPTGTNVYSYHDINPRNFYCPFSSTNLIGYTNDNSRMYREHALLARAISYVRDEIPLSLDLDSDNDGYVDNICFIIKGGTTEWNTLLWPHKWSLSSELVLIHGKFVYNYNLQLSEHIESHGVGVLCHEFGHTLGLPDLYHGYSDPNTGRKWEPVGEWDIMAANGYYPQQMSCYMKYKYLNWVDGIPTITRSGRYSLAPITSSPQCYKIGITGSSEFLYLEYRKKTQQYDRSIPNSGLLIYRINPSLEGNFNAVECGGINDEVYVYRPYGTFTSDGYIYYAPFCQELNATTFNENTNPQEFLSNGSTGNIYISNVTNCDSTISFDVKMCSANDIHYIQYFPVPPYTNAKSITASGTLFFMTNNTVFEASEYILLESGFNVPQGKVFNAHVKPCE